MNFISYSQNYEDVILFRALKGVEHGFYVDVGAQDPIADSVTKAFYDRGWRGINIEPVEYWYKKLLVDRPEDHNLMVAAAAEAATVKFYDVVDTGMSTVDAGFAAKHAAAGFEVHEKEVPTRRLGEICDELGVTEINFLKIDVEGAEGAVLGGIDLMRIRPWVILLESVEPNSTISTHEQWEGQLTTSGYVFVHFDGLNRFYVPRERKQQLKVALSTPPNYFDHFIRYSELWAGQLAGRMELEAADARNRLQGMESKFIQSQRQGDALQQGILRLEGELAKRDFQVDALIREVDGLSCELQAVYATYSWRYSEPLRKAKFFVKEFAHTIKARFSIMSSLPRCVVRWVLRSALAQMQARPECKAKAVSLLANFPKLDARLHAFARANRHTGLVLSPKKNLVSVLAPPSLDALQIGTDFQVSGSAPLAFPLHSGNRFIYYYVDHTILCPVNTGVQRVTRCLARALREQDEQVRFVKWDASHQKIILVNQAELAYLSQWHGPVFSEEELKFYPSGEAELIAVGTHALEEGHWLVVPEVTYITFHAQPVTLEIIMAAKQLGLKSVFVFYDAIPLRRTEFAEVAPDHEAYMRQLLLADLVLPISDWSAGDLVSFFDMHECETFSLPKVSALALPGESQFVPRVTIPATLGEVGKLILSVGTIEPRKNQVALVRAFEKFCADHPDNGWHLNLVGNLHPKIESEITLAVKRNSRISYLGNIQDSELNALYRSSAFTVFPSVDEGFGLPILESLWYAKPCICANFGAMKEVAEGGGCLMVDVIQTSELVRAITRMTMEPGLLDHLTHEAANRSISTWADYAKGFIKQIEHENDPINQLGVIYYWVDHTSTYPFNSGIQRVVRGLARSLLSIGLKVIPVKWDRATNQLYAPSEKELKFLALWNGPKPSEWAPWVDPSQSVVNDWILIPELTTYLEDNFIRNLKHFASTYRLRVGWIFYDAIPLKMQDIYPPEATFAHIRYMEGLNEFEKVFAISEHSRCDLTRFLEAKRTKTPNLDDRIQACLLPGEFLEASRVSSSKPKNTDVINILCVCTVEPRKNHLSLLEAFAKVRGQIESPVELVLVGGSLFIDLRKKVEQYIKSTPGIHWEQNPDDTRLRELYANCDFTVYPSLEEGFGLPILESLWNARPCICRNSGSMAEVAEGGGCLTVETADAMVLAEAMCRLIVDDELRLQLAHEAITRSFKTWADYAREVATRMATERQIFLPRSLPDPQDKSEFYDTFVNLRHRPLLSICITTYNRAEWLELSLKNLIQLIPNSSVEIEIVVCDNTSTDQTPDVVKPYLDRTDFRYYRNPKNVGMLGNLRVTAHHASGQYIWVLGDDDLVKPGTIERVLQAIRDNPETALVYLNYAYTNQDDPKAVIDLESFLDECTPIVTPGPDIKGPVHKISTQSENFFTAIYCLVFRRDHALRAYSQNTVGRPFSTMLTCIPTTYYVLNFMMNEPAYWMGSPQLVVNMNVSWLKYAPIWILERLPEAHDLAEKMGANPQEVDRCRMNHLPHLMHWFREIFENDTESNVEYFSASRLVSRMKHLDGFEKDIEALRDIYHTNHSRGTPGAKVPTSLVFAAFESRNKLRECE